MRAEIIKPSHYTTLPFPFQVGPWSHPPLGPPTLVINPLYRYAIVMETKAMNQIKTLALLATLALGTPAAQAAKSPADKAKKAVNHGLESLEAQQYAEAIEKFTEATRLDPRDPGAHFLRGYAHYQRGFIGGDPEAADKDDATETVRSYSVVLAMDPELASVSQPYRFYHSLALSFEALDANDKAVDAYKKAFALAPTNPMLPLYAARMRYRLGDQARSAANMALALRKARQIKKEAQVMRLLKTDPYFSAMLKSPIHRRLLGEYDPASAGSEDAPDTEGAPELAMASNEEGRDLRDSVKDSTDQRRQIISETSQESAVLRRMATANEEFKFGRYREAIDAYNETMGINQETQTLNPAQMSLIYERMGTSYNKLGLSAGAVKALRYSVQEMPGNANSHYQLALAYSVSGKFSHSLKALGEAFRNAPSQGELKKLMLLAKTDGELDPVRELPGFKSIMGTFQDRLTARR